MPVKVIDSPCGSGKTTALIQYLIDEKLKNSDFRFVYITPFLSEVEKVIKNFSKYLLANPTIMNCYNPIDNVYFEDNFICMDDIDSNSVNQPQASSNSSKSINFETNINKHRCVITTHNLLLRYPTKFCDLLKDNNYTLYIDESLKMIDTFNVKKADFKDWIKTEKIIYDKSKKSLELSNDYKDADKSTFNDHFRKIVEYDVYCLSKSVDNKNNITLINVFPIESFKSLPQVVVSTYLFEGDPMRYYLDMAEIDYEYYHVVDKKDKDGNILPYEYQLIKGVSDLSGKDYKKFIEVYEHKHKHKRKDGDLNKYWLKECFNLSWGNSTNKFLSNEQVLALLNTKSLIAVPKKYSDGYNKCDSIGGKQFNKDVFLQKTKKSIKSIKNFYSIDTRINESYYFDKEENKEVRKYEYENQLQVSLIRDAIKIANLDEKAENLIDKVMNTAHFCKKIHNYLKNEVKAKKKDVIWTAFKSHHSGLQTELNLQDNSYEVGNQKVEDEKTNFCVSIMRATNKFSDKSVLVYAIEKNWNTTYKNIMKHINPNHKIEDQNIYKCSEMIQWVFRSRIRKFNKNSTNDPNECGIKIYIPNQNNRKLMNDWLDGKYDTKVLLEKKANKLKKLKEKEAEDKKSPNKGKREHNQN